MWLYAKNMDKDKTDMEMLIQTSKMNKVPVARMSCHYETNRAPRSDHQQPTVWESHFDERTHDKNTDTCIGARVAISNVNILPEIELHNGAVGTVVEIVNTNRPVGPTDKEHYRLPDYVVVDFPRSLSQNGELEMFPHYLLEPHVEIFPNMKNNQEACSTYSLP
jgi:hypothetical protein